MENRPKKSLSLKKQGKQGQKKLNFATQGQGPDSSSAPQPPGAAEGAELEAAALPASSSTSSSASWLSGLCNLGNTCYANSILQVLRFCPLLSAKVTSLSEILLNEGAANNTETGGVEGSEDCGEDWPVSKGALVIYLHKVMLNSYFSSMTCTYVHVLCNVKILFQFHDM